MMRTDYIWIIVKVGKKVNSYDIRKRRPTSLPVNSYAFRMEVKLDADNWFTRISRETLVAPIIEPPPSPIPKYTGESYAEKTPEHKVYDELKGGK